MTNNNVKFEDNIIKVIAALDDNAVAFLHEMAGEVVSQLKTNTPVDTGQLKNSWEYKVDNNKAFIGSPLENSMFNEFGTGEYALQGNGRKGGWYVPEEKLSSKAKSKMKKVVIKGKTFYFTKGKKPNRTMFKTFTRMKPKIISEAERRFRDRMK